MFGWKFRLSILFIAILIPGVVSAQFVEPILISDGVLPVTDGRIHLDTSCPTCAPQQVSVCALSGGQILFSGSVMQMGTMIPALDSSAVLGSPSLTQGSAAHYLISHEEAVGTADRGVYLIESFAVGFGDPQLMSPGAGDQYDSRVTILDGGQRVITWTRDLAGQSEIILKYGGSSPVNLGTGMNSQISCVGDNSALIVWQEGTELHGRIADSGSLGGEFVLYDLLTIPTAWQLQTDSYGNIRIVVLLDDQLVLLTGSLILGVTNQEVISDRVTGITELCLDQLSMQRYCVSWIQDGLIHRYSVSPGETPATETIDVVGGNIEEIEVAIDGAGFEHYLVISDGDAWYFHNTTQPQAAIFIHSEDDGVADHTILFESISEGLISDFLWDFGDGQVSTDPDGEHTYLEPGTYPVSLTVTGPGGTDTVMASTPIVVSPPETSMELADIAVFGGQPVFHPVLGTYSQPLQGFQIALEYDGEILDMSAISLDGTQAQALSPEFIISQINPAGVDSTMYLAVIFDTLPPFDGRMMSPGSNQTLCTLDYQVSFGQPQGTSTEIRFSVGVGDPPINTIYAVEGGFSEAPYMIHGTVTISEQPQFLFVRGDANYNQSVNIADAIFMLDYLFIGGPPSVCPDAADCNDDGVVNIGDAVALLNFLFSGGATIPYPYPGYGVDPTADDLGACLP